MIENLLIRFLRWLGAEEVTVEAAALATIEPGSGTRDPFAQYPDGINPTLGADDGPPPVTLEDPDAEDEAILPPESGIATGTWARAILPRSVLTDVAATEATSPVTVYEAEQPQSMGDWDVSLDLLVGIVEYIPITRQQGMVAAWMGEPSDSGEFDDDGPVPDPLPIRDEPEIDAAVATMRESQNRPFHPNRLINLLSRHAPRWKSNMPHRVEEPDEAWLREMRERRQRFMVAFAAAMILFAGWFIAGVGTGHDPSTPATTPPGRVDIGALADSKVEETEPPTAAPPATTDDDAVASTSDDDGDVAESVAEVPSTPSPSPQPVAATSLRNDAIADDVGAGHAQPVPTASTSPTLVPVPQGTKTSPLSGWAAQREIDRRLGRKPR